MHARVRTCVCVRRGGGRCVHTMLTRFYILNKKEWLEYEGEGRWGRRDKRGGRVRDEERLRKAEREINRRDIFKKYKPYKAVVKFELQNLCVFTIQMKNTCGRKVATSSSRILLFSDLFEYSFFTFIQLAVLIFTI